MSWSAVVPAQAHAADLFPVDNWIGDGLKKVGDEVAVDEALLEVSTDKVDTEIPSPVAGTLLEIRAHDDDTVEVGAVLGVIGSSDEAGGGESDDGDGGGVTYGDLIHDGFRRVYIALEPAGIDSRNR